MSVAFLFAPLTAHHTFQIIVHHFLTFAFRVGFCLAVASDCKFFHNNAKFYVYHTAAPTAFSCLKSIRFNSVFILTRKYTKIFRYKNKIIKKSSPNYHSLARYLNTFKILITLNIVSL